MEKKLEDNPNGHTMLTRAEMQSVAGGSILETIVKLVISGAEFCFHMGIREAQRMKAQL